MDIIIKEQSIQLHPNTQRKLKDLLKKYKRDEFPMAEVNDGDGQILIGKGLVIPGENGGYRLSSEGEMIAAM